MCVCVYIYMCVCVCVCIKYMCTHTHTHTQLYFFLHTVQDSFDLQSVWIGSGAFSAPYVVGSMVSVQGRRGTGT